jgi:hypothetical protein
MVRHLLRGVVLAGILWAILAQPLLVPHCEWAELNGQCFAGEDGGCTWVGDSGVCW